MQVTKADCQSPIRWLISYDRCWTFRQRAGAGIGGARVLRRIGCGLGDGRCHTFVCSTRAVSALEYAIVVGVVVVAIEAALVTFQQEVTNALNGAASSMSGVPGLSVGP